MSVDSLVETTAINKDILRISQQKVIESKLDTMRGKSLIERLTSTRETIFEGLDSVNGDLPTQIRQSYANLSVGGIDVVPSAKDLSESLFPSYIRTIDTLYDQLLANPETNQDAVLRFCALVYCTGIILHPYSDGNGQTLKLVTLSYLHEFLPQTREYFFPTRDTLQKTKSEAFMNGVEDIPRIDTSVPFDLVEKIPLDFTDPNPLIVKYLEKCRTEDFSSEIDKMGKQLILSGASEALKNAQQKYSQMQTTELISYITSPESFELLTNILKNGIDKADPGNDPFKKIVITMVQNFVDRMSIDGQLEDRNTHQKNYE